MDSEYILYGKSGELRWTAALAITRPCVHRCGALQDSSACRDMLKANETPVKSAGDRGTQLATCTVTSIGQINAN